MKKLLASAALCALLASAAEAQARMGSIFNPDLGPQNPIANRTARRPGDILTILISENQDVSNTESSNLKKETNLDMALNDLDIFPNAFDPLPSLAATSIDELKGTGNYSKQGRFDARMTVIVVDTHPNGNLVLSGRREIRIDQEVKLIEFTGVVRRYDVAADNTVQSSRVANATISYEGAGPLTNATNRTGLGGWIHDAIAWLWPF